MNLVPKPHICYHVCLGCLGLCSFVGGRRRRLRTNGQLLCIIYYGPTLLSDVSRAAAEARASGGRGAEGGGGGAGAAAAATLTITGTTTS